MNIYMYFLLFIIYSFLGWSIEVIDKFIEKKRFINRGFLIGPLCPIYGFGALFAILLLSKYKDDILVCFILSVVIFSILEYSTSYIMEKLFNTRWWDYTRKKYNINGRICLKTMIPFGIGGVAVICLINPLVVNLLNNIPEIIKIIFAIIIAMILLMDIMISYLVINKVKGSKAVTKDSTEEMNEKVLKYLSKGKILDRRLINAFPNMRIKGITKEKIKDLKNKFRQQEKHLKQKEKNMKKNSKNHFIR